MTITAAKQFELGKLYRIKNNFWFHVVNDASITIAKAPTPRVVSLLKDNVVFLVKKEEIKDVSFYKKTFLYKGVYYTIGSGGYGSTSGVGGAVTITGGYGSTLGNGGSLTLIGGTGGATTSSIGSSITMLMQNTSTVNAVIPNISYEYYYNLCFVHKARNINIMILKTLVEEQKLLNEYFELIN